MTVFSEMLDFFFPTTVQVTFKSCIHDTFVSLTFSVKKLRNTNSV